MYHQQPFNRIEWHCGIAYICEKVYCRIGQHFAIAIEGKCSITSAWTGLASWLPLGFRSVCSVRLCFPGVIREKYCPYSPVGPVRPPPAVPPPSVAPVFAHPTKQPTHGVYAFHLATSVSERAAGHCQQQRVHRRGSKPISKFATCVLWFSGWFRMATASSSPLARGYGQHRWPHGWVINFLI